MLFTLEGISNIDVYCQEKYYTIHILHHSEMIIKNNDSSLIFKMLKTTHYCKQETVLFLKYKLERRTCSSVRLLYF